MNPKHERMLAQLVSQLEPDQDIAGLVVFGSACPPEAHYDDWSDIDLLVILKNNALEKFFPDITWIESLGRLYTYDQSADDLKCTTRAVFENLERIDFVFMTEEKVKGMDRWAGSTFASGTKIIFSRTAVVDDMFHRTWASPKTAPVPAARFPELVRDFRFKAMLAVYKVVRGDLLVALHLSQDLVRDCCVLGMMLRDRAMGTSVHRQGGMGNTLVTELEKTQKPFTTVGILESIEESNERFEKLGCEWSSTYLPRGELLTEWIQKAQTELQR